MGGGGGFVKKAVGGGKALLFGEKTQTGGAEEIGGGFRSQAQQLLGDVIGRERKQFAKFDPTQEARAGVSRERRALRGAQQDRLRSLRQRIAQQGLQGTSIGLGQEVGIGRDFATQQALLQADLPARIRRLRGGESARLAAIAQPATRAQFAQRATRGRSQGLIQGLIGGAGEAGGSALGQAGAKALLCWVARAIFGEDNPKWLQARHYVLEIGPEWFRDLYISHGPAVAEFISNKPLFKLVLRPVFEYFAWRARVDLRYWGVIDG